MQLDMIPFPFHISEMSVELIKLFLSFSSSFITGELLTRGWDTLPLPDLTQIAQDAASLILELCAVQKSNNTSSGTVAGSWRQQPQLQTTQPPRRTMVTLGGGAATTFNNTAQPRSNTAALGMVSGNPSFDAYNMNNNNNNNDRNKNKNLSSSRSDKHPKTSSRKRDRWGANMMYSDSDSDNDDRTSQGGPFSADEDARRRRRAGRFKDGTADGVNSNQFSNSSERKKEKRRAKLSALLDDKGGTGEDIDWNQFAIKVGESIEICFRFYQLCS